MDEEKSTSMIDVIKNIFQSSFKLVNDMLHLIHLEMQLASKSLKILSVLVVIQVVLLSTTWLGINAVIICALRACHLHWIAAFAIDAGINLLILLFITLYMLRLSHNITFSATRRLLTRDDKKQE